MGTSVTVQELGAEPMSQAGLAQLEYSETSTRRDTILVVEDDAAVREVTCRILESHGYMVLIAANGEEGIRVFDEHQGNIHVLLTDMTMPGMSGRELVRELVERDEGLKAIIVSGYEMGEEAYPGLANCEHLKKPFTLESLTRKVREVIDGTKYPGESRRVN